MKLRWLWLCSVALFLPVCALAQPHMRVFEPMDQLPILQPSPKAPYLHKFVTLGDAFQRYAGSTDVGDITEREARYFTPGTEPRHFDRI